jgi:hypothetical protein
MNTREVMMIVSLSVVMASTPVIAVDPTTPDPKGTCTSCGKGAAPDPGVKSPIPGPFTETNQLPVSPTQTGNTAAAASKEEEIKRIDEILQTQKLSRKKRKALEQRRGELQAERLSIPSESLSSPK